tara:strand:+ start:313 stop:585 length:273 start_codon:yes stop_codon:yes gene_type:complete
MNYERKFPNNIKPFTNIDFCEVCEIMKEVEDLTDGVCGDCMEKHYSDYINGISEDRYTHEEINELEDEELENALDQMIDNQIEDLLLEKY